MHRILIKTFGRKPHIKKHNPWSILDYCYLSDANENKVSILIFDGCRPWSVTKVFWDIAPLENRRFVPNPKVGSRHNRGCAIDLSLLKLDSGKEVPMTSQYDEMSERSYPDFSGGTVEQRMARDLLINKMEDHGFTVYEYEWWHFDFQGWETYRIQNIQFSEIE